MRRIKGPVLLRYDNRARGVKFIAAAVDSSSKNGAWVDARLAL